MENKSSIIISVLLLLVLLNFGCLSATTWTKSIEYENNDLDVVFKNWWGFGGEQGKIELKSHPTIEYVKPMGLGWGVTMYYDFMFNEDLPNVLGEVEFVNMKNNQPIEREWKYVYWFEETREREVCSAYSKTLTKNGTIEECSNYETEKYTHGEWKDYNSKDIPKGNIRVGIMVNNKEGDYIDGIWNIGSKRITKHAVWTASLETNLISWFNLDETSGTTAFDSLGLNNMTNYNGVSINQTGKINNAYNYTSASYLYKNSFMTYGNSITHAFWIKPAVTDGGIYYSQSAASVYEDIGLTGGNIQYSFGAVAGSNNVWTMKEVPLNFNEWIFVVVTSTGDGTTGSTTIYINGTAVPTDKTSAGANRNRPSGTANFKYNYNGYGSSDYRGQIDEIAVWNRVLSSDEVLNVYHSYLGCTYEYCVGQNIIELLNPLNDSFFSTNEIDFSVNVTSVRDIENVSLYINEELMQTNNSGIKGIYNFTETLTEGTYNWSIRSSNDLGDTTISEYRTLFIDATQPSINVTSPLSSYDYLYNNQSINLNYSISDTNLDKCWYNYNSVNTTLNCSTNDSFYYVAGVNNLIVYANDSAGNIQTENVNWNVKVTENNRNYNPLTQTTTLENYYLNFTTNTSVIPITYLVYDGVEYLSTRTGNTTNHQISNSIGLNNSGNYTFQWKITYGSETIYTRNLTQEVAVVEELNIASGAVCPAGLTQVMYFDFKDENNLTSLNNVNIKVNIKYGIDFAEAGSSYGLLNLISNFSLCINTTATSTYQISEGEIEYIKDGYSSRRFYLFENSRLSNQTINNTLYLLPSADSTSFLLEIRSPTLVPYPEVYTTMLKWYPELNEYNIVEMGKTDDKGQTVKKIKIEDTDYRIGVYEKDGTLIYMINPVRMVCLSSPCSYTINVPSEETSNWEEVDNIQTELTYGSGIFTLTYNDPSQNTEIMSLRVYHISGSNNRLICESNGTSFTGILSCDISGYEGTFKAEVIRTASPERILDFLIVDTLTTIFQGTFGLFLQFLLTVTLVFLGIVNPIVSIILGIISLLFGVFIFKTVTYPILIGIGIMGGIIIHFMKRQ